MDTASLKPFAQDARRQLLDQVGARLEQVLRTDSAELREKKKTLGELQERIDQTSRQAVVDRVAYTWFNRFCALRFMDVNHYTRVGIVSPAEGRTQPEILQDAKQGLVADWLKVDRQRVLDLLSGKATSSNPQQEAYRFLLVGACNAYHDQMPFLFEKIEDYTELLMPEDLLSENSVVQAVRDALTPETCQDVEVIGWLYQYYISERKNEVFDSLKQNKKIQPEDIPAATQLFTPHWIVRYLVENSLGRLWMLNHSESKLVEQMDYYIQPEQEDTDLLKIGSPEQIRVCDPACGSGHMLTYAFDLLYAIYEEQGYDPVEIPRWILENNLYGIEIDERAGHLAAFALMMKAREQDRRFFSRGVEPNICVLGNVAFAEDELDAYMDALGRDLFTQDLQETLTQFEYADNFGSLIQPKVKDVGFIRQRIDEQGVFEDLFLHQTNMKVLTVLAQAEYLSSRYHVVVTNPPYMGSRGMNKELKTFSQARYPTGKSDLFAMFIERNFDLVTDMGFIGMLTMQSWMFLSSFVELREEILRQASILSMAHLGARAFDSIGGEVVSTTAFVIGTHQNGALGGIYIRLINGIDESDKESIFRENMPDNGKKTPPLCFRASTADFNKIPGSPIAYWAKNSLRNIFGSEERLGKKVKARQGLASGDNARFLRYLWEVSQDLVGVGCSAIEECREAKKKWYPINKGGPFRKWFGNFEYLIAFDSKNRDALKSMGNHLPSEHLYFRSSVSWSDITTAVNSFRYYPEGFLFDATGHSAFTNRRTSNVLLCYCNSKLVNVLSKILNPTIHFHVGYFNLLPYPSKLFAPHLSDKFTDSRNDLVSIARTDWDSHETSWNFSSLPLMQVEHRNSPLVQAYDSLRAEWRLATDSMQTLEEMNNRFVIEAYELQDALTPDVAFGEITLTCNPHYRYPDTSRKTYTDEEREAMLLADTMKEFVSYAVGCMFGRYSLDKPGLILANQGETVEDYLEQVPDPTFPPDEDNVIPILDEGWFVDDIAERFKQFLQVTFGTENYEENLAFLEGAIRKDIRSYFLKSFYGEHVKMYKKRPIYWQFSSPSGNFNALIYMHRYRSDTLSVILNGYLRQYHEKLRAHRERLEQASINPSAGRGEKTKALKEIDKISKILTELKVYEDEILYPLAAKQVEIDLDDGVNVNYKKFGRALKPVSGLS